MKKTLTTLSLIIVMVLLSNSFVLAASPTPEEDKTATKSDTENIQELIKKKAAENQVKGISTGNQVKRGFIATVKRVSEEALTVDTRKGTEIITLSADVSIIQDNKAFKVTNIEIDSQVVIMGYQDGEDFSPRRILVLKKPLQSAPKTIWIGSVKKIDKLSITLTSRSGEEKTFSLTSKPVIDNNKNDTLKLTDIETDQGVILITIPEDSTNQSVKDSSGKIVHIRSLAASDEKTTSKETPTPTPKATTKPTATPQK